MRHCKEHTEDYARGIGSTTVREKHSSDSGSSSFIASLIFCLPHFSTSAAEALWTSEGLEALRKHRRSQT